MVMRKKGLRGHIIFLFGILFIFVQSPLFAQVPTITNIDKKFGTVNEEVLISGSGFGDDISKLNVFFGGAKGTVLQSTGNSVLVSIPAGATSSNIVIENKTNGLQAYSKELFYISYGGNEFIAGNMDTEIDFAVNKELLDLSMCDFDADGRLDIAATPREGLTEFYIYKNNSSVGNILFTRLDRNSNLELDVGSPTAYVVCGDLDGDGKQDLVLTKEGQPRNVIYMLRNISTTGNIKFETKKELYLGSDDFAVRLAVRDLDLDGKPEIIVTNTENPEVSVFLNTGTIGTIQFQTTPSDFTIEGASGSKGLAVEDLNNDGYPEIITNQLAQPDIYIQPNESSIGNLVFGSSITVAVQGGLNNMTPGDFNCDGKVDIAVTKTVDNKISILYNSYDDNVGDITFENPYDMDAQSFPSGIVTADMNGDSKLDIIVTTIQNNVFDVYKNTSDESTKSFVRVPIPSNFYTRNIKAGDLDGDAKPDIAFTSFGTSDFSLSIIRNGNCVEPSILPAGPLVLCATDDFDLYATKGIGLTYEWYKGNGVIAGETGSSINITEVETLGYKVLVGSEGGVCSKFSNAVIVNSGSGTVPDNPVITNDGPFCEGGTIILSTEVVTNAVYYWDGPNDYTSSNQNISIPDATSGMAGQYNLRVQVDDCSSDISSSLVEIITMPDFEITTSDSTAFCNGDNATLQITSISGYSYQWTLNGSDITGATTTSYIATASGTYGVDVLDNTYGCTTSSTSLDILVIQNVVADFSVDPEECVGQELGFTNNSTYDAGYTIIFNWDFGDGSTSQDASPTHTYQTAGTYTVTLSVAYSNGACSDLTTNSVIINDSPVFTIDKSPNEEVCSGDTVNLEVIPDFAAYLWNTGEETKNIDIFNTGAYSVTVINTKGCANKDSIDVSFQPSPEIIITFDPDTILKPGVSVQLEASGALFYNWSPGVTLSDSTIANPIASPNDTTTYVVIGTDASDCQGRAEITIYPDGGGGIQVDPRNLFSPNSDGIDDTWVIGGIENYQDCTVLLYTDTGANVYEQTNYSNDWDAVYDGNDLPEGTYYYIIRCDDGKTKSGFVMVVR
ncbi:FG-GAP-like repeat-containing protein [Bacteroidota bacterium]